MIEVPNSMNQTESTRCEPEPIETIGHIGCKHLDYSDNYDNCINEGEMSCFEKQCSFI